MKRDNRFVLAYFIAIMLYFMWLHLQYAFPADFDTNTVEIVEIRTVYDFIVRIDTIISNTHHYIPLNKHWYVNGKNDRDYISDKQPVILKQFKEWE